MPDSELPAGPIDPGLTWGEDGLPRSALYGDVYFSSEDGLAETRAVFLAGGGLPEAWAGRRAFTVAELGFGTGLNIAALLDLWSREKTVGGRLHVFSVEAHPVSRQDAARSLATWPELAPVTDLLLARWPRRARGFHRIDLPELDATIDLAVMEVEEALTRWSGAADLWFLDGFAPSANPAMWRQAVLDLVAARSAAGAAIATFTVAGAVRRGLAQAGFEVAKRPGFGRKRERLEARLPGAAAEPPLPSVAVIGAGIAGASLARAFRALGVEPLVFDPRGPGGGASGNPGALVTPRLDAGLGPAAKLYAQAFAFAVDAYRATPGGVIAQGALLLENDPRDAARFAKVAAGDLFEPGALTLPTADDVAARVGEPARAGVAFADGLVIEPASVLPAWLGPVRREAVAALEHGPNGWRLLDGDGQALATVDVVCIAAGHRAEALWPAAKTQPVRGQASFTAAAAMPVATSFSAYAIPLREGLLFGATFDRDRTDEAADPADDARNLALLAEGLPRLAGTLAGAPLSSRAAIRATTPDHLPLAGAAPHAPPGLFLLGGQGSRGFCTAPLLAAHVAALATGAPSPLPTDLATIVEPARFGLRAARRASPGPRRSAMVDAGTGSSTGDPK
jgi:tRNA 5-methylaminomethyl-2-thiouridine biosynthesis bifunctional protein